jgi:multisubunit Na+/H+ antiporter MnhE subunit
MAVVIGGLVLLWIALAGSLDPLSIGIGILIATGAALVQRHLFPAVHLHAATVLLRRPHQLAAFLATLAVRFVVSTARTCRLILFGKPEGLIVALPVRLRTPFAQFLLQNAITLLPSTISVLLEEDLLYIHWLQAKGQREDWQVIKEGLETRLEAALERGIDVGD